jgi:hypothetical protein
MFLGKLPTWRTILFYVFISILCMFRAPSCSSSGETKCVNTTSGICHSVFCVQVGTDLSDRHKKRSPTHSDIYQMLYWYIWFSWWWARGCSKHVENLNKYIEKNCASSWSFSKKFNTFLTSKNNNFKERHFTKRSPLESQLLRLFHNATCAGIEVEHDRDEEEANPTITQENKNY